MTAETNDYIYDEVNDQVNKSKGSTNKDQGTDSKVSSNLMTDVWDEISWCELLDIDESRIRDSG